MENFINWLLNDSEQFQYFLYFGLLFLLISIELILHEYKEHKRPARRRKRWTANFTITFLNILVLSILPVSFITASFYGEYIEVGALRMIELPVAIMFILGLLLRGFISFFTHYLAHKVPFLWRIHRVHHLDTDMDVSTTVRFHPLEFVVNLLIGIPLVIGFGLSAWVLMFYELLDISVTLISHSKIHLPYPVERYLRYIIVTPDLHRVHHSSYQAETDSNFSAVFPVWDIIFGTFRTKKREAQKKMELGLEEVRDDRTQSIWWLLVSPIKNFTRPEENRESD